MDIYIVYTLTTPCHTIVQLVESMLVIPNWLLFVNQTAGVLQHTVTLNIGLKFLQQLRWESYTISFVILHCLT